MRSRHVSAAVTLSLSHLPAMDGALPPFDCSVNLPKSY